jgi:PKD repeat protein
MHPNGFFMVSSGGATVGVFQIGGSGSATTLGAVAGSPFPGGINTASMALNGAGTLLFATNDSTRNLTTFNVNTTTGALSVPNTQPTDALGGAGGISGMGYVSQPAPIMIASGATAAPSPAGVGQTVTFTTAGSGGFGQLTYSWSFGDGTSAPGASVGHAYTVAGTYTATVTATDSIGTSTTASVTVTVNNPIVGVGPDSDGDGFSDAFETAVGGNPIGGPVTAATLQLLTLVKPSIKLNFAKANSDSITVPGVVIVPTGFNPNGAKVYFDVGEVVKSFTLASGAAKTATSSVKFSIKATGGVVLLQTAKFTASFKGAFAATLAADGLTNAAASNKPVTVLYTLIFNNTVLQKSQTLHYTAKAGKGGAAK